MTCAELEELLSAQLDGALSPQEQRALEAHLKVCPSCRALQRELLALSQFTAGDEALLSPPPDFTQKVMAQIRAEAPKNKVVPLFRRPVFRNLAGVAACLVLMAGLYRGVLSQSGGSADVAQSRTASSMELTVQSEEPAETENSGALEVAGQAVDQILFLDRLPQGAEELLSDCVPTQDEQGRTCYFVTAEQFSAVAALPDVPAASPVSAAPGSRTGLCAIIITET